MKRKGRIIISIVLALMLVLPSISAGLTAAVPVFADEEWPEEQPELFDAPEEGGENFIPEEPAVQDVMYEATEVETVMEAAPVATVTVEFNMGGHGEEIEPVTVEPGHTLEKPDDPEEYGYTFVGWYLDPEFETEWNFEEDIVYEDMTLYALWEEVVQIIPEEPVIPEEQIIPEEQVIPEVQVSPEEQMIPEVQVNPEEQIIPEEQVIPEEITIVNTDTVTKTPALAGTKPAPPLKAPSDEAITSVELSLLLPGEGGSYMGAVPADVSYKGEVNFTIDGAYWFKGEGEGIGLAPKTFEAGVKYFSEIHLDAKDGYVFTDSTTVTLTGGAAVDVEKISVKDSGKRLTVITTNVDPLPKVVGINAHVSDIEASSGEYKVKVKDGSMKTLFESTTAAVTMSVSSLYTEQACSNKLTTAPVPGTDYYFYIAADAFKDGDPATLRWAENDVIKSGSTLTADNAAVEIAEISHGPAGGSLTVIVKYTEPIVNHTVTFDANGQGTAPEKQTVEHGKKAVKPTDPIEEGYSFGGWYTNAACKIEDEYLFTEEVNNDIILYAKWMVNVIGLKLHADGTKLDGTYYMPNLDTLEPVFEKDKESVESECGHLCTDSACTNVITTPPEKGTTYYFQLYLKDPSSYDTGIQKVMFLPEIINNIEASAEDATIELDSDFGTSEHPGLSGSPSGDSVTLQFKYTEKEITYTISKGADATWTKGSSSGMDYIVNRNISDSKTYSLFKSIEMDGAAIAASNYKVSSGSLNATLNASYLETLSEGTHTVKYNFEDGSAETKLTIKAEPAKTYTVSFNTNGGSAVTAQTVEEGKTATKPADPTREGYKFIGWYADSAFATAFDFTKAITADTTVYAKWEKKTYTVSFNTDGGSSVDPQTVDEGKTATQPADPTKDGYRFAGWYADSAFAAAFDFSKAIMSDTTVYAKWDKTHIVVFDVNGYGTAPAAQTVVDGEKAVKPADPTAAGRTFGGWYLDKACTKPYDFSTPVTADIRLYAKWTVGTLTPVPAGGTAEAAKTGDNSHVVLWVVLLAAAAAALVVVLVKKKQMNKN